MFGTLRGWYYQFKKYGGLFTWKRVLIISHKEVWILEYKILNNIDSPTDIKKLNNDEIALLLEL